LFVSLVQHLHDFAREWRLTGTSGFLDFIESAASSTTLADPMRLTGPGPGSAAATAGAEIRE
jgi:hypothetical protein